MKSNRSFAELVVVSNVISNTGDVVGIVLNSHAVADRGLVNRFVSKKKVGIQLLRSCKIPTDIPVYQVTPFQLERLSQMCHDWRFPVISRGNWQNAQVTAGGIPLKQLRKNSLESKWISGLFFSGEILDLHGECGGYNLNWAWCSGQYAGMELLPI